MAEKYGETTLGAIVNALDNIDASAGVGYQAHRAFI